MKKITHQFLNLFLFILFAICLNCAALQDFANIQKPKLNVEKLRFTGMTFQTIDLALDIRIDNPNTLSAKLSGFDYDLMIDNASFLKGEQIKELVIESMGQSTIEIPLSLNFMEVYKTFQALANQDSTGFQISTGLSFDLPVLGITRIPISYQGHLPLIKLPEFKVGSLKMKKLNLTGADLELKLDINNPNFFNLLLNSLNYELQINGLSWAKGNTRNSMPVKEKGNSTLTIPLSLNFLQMGQTVYQLISGNQKVNYHFTGDLNLNSSLPLLKQVKLPIDRSGQVSITR